jgi:hypothetical protein
MGMPYEKKSVRDLKKKLASQRAKNTKAARECLFEQVLEKEKVEGAEDIMCIFNGLSKKAKDRAAITNISICAAWGHSPKEIVEYMEGEARQ